MLKEDFGYNNSASTYTTMCCKRPFIFLTTDITIMPVRLRLYKRLDARHNRSFPYLTLHLWQYHTQEAFGN